MASSSSRLRRVLLQIHLWLALGLGLLLVPVSLSGALLVFGDEVDAWLRPSSFAVSGSKLGMPLDAYFATAALAVPGGTPTVLRVSEDGPAIVLVRSGAARTPRAMQMVYVDPPTGRVLGVAASGDSVMGLAHRFHENLLLPQWGGRSIVGWIGVAMLILSLTGIWIWWPRHAGFLRGLAWRRGPSANDNLHHLLGFWIALPLALISLTGMYLAFPSQARTLLGSVATLSPQGERPGSAPLLQQPRLSAQQALDAAREVAGPGDLRSLSMPGGQDRSWKVVFADARGGQAMVAVDDATSVARPGAVPQTGDAIAAWVRRVHAGQHYGPVWQLITLLTGLLPTLFLVTGIAIWLRKRSLRKRLTLLRTGAATPASSAAE